MEIDKLLQYPHLAARIETTWGTIACRQLLLDLLSDSRDGKREGFPPDVASEIFKLMVKHDEEFPACNVALSEMRTFVSVPRPIVVVRQEADWGFVKYIAKVIMVVLVAVLVVKLFR